MLAIGTRRELLLDDYLFAEINPGIEFKQHRPRPQNVIISDDRPWEKEINYVSVLASGDKFMLYYRGFHHGSGEIGMGEPTCLAISKDGVNWEKPELGLFGFAQSPANNIVLGGNYDSMPATQKWRGYLGKDLRWRGEIAAFIDADGTFRTLLRGARGYHQIHSRRYDYGMYPAESVDGLNWKVLTEKPAITKGQFDSQNLAIYDRTRQRYAAFTRDTHGLGVQDDNEKWQGEILRDIRVAFSNDFISWSEPEYLKYHDDEKLQLYTNAIISYERAPHLLLGFPTIINAESQTAPRFMFSRDGGTSFKRLPLVLIPHDAPSERDGDRSNYLAHGLIKANENELFCYATEGYKDGPSRRLRRFVWRTDGFVSLAGKGRAMTVPLKVGGNKLVLNYRGQVSVKILALSNQLLGKSEFSGDAVEATADLNFDYQQPIRIEFDFLNGEIFSFQMKNEAE